LARDSLLTSLEGGDVDYSFTEKPSRGTIELLKVSPGVLDPMDPTGVHEEQKAALDQNKALGQK
jgi:hypothetical protein